MGEILFRGKSVDSGEWLYGHYTEYAGFAQIWMNTDNGQWNFLVDPSTVGQYTGLKDKNGKQIFEGDIIKTNKYGKDDGNGRNFSGYDYFRVKFCDGGYHMMHKFRRFNLRPDADAEVIGNIHDNPELLEGGEG